MHCYGGYRNSMASSENWQILVDLKLCLLLNPVIPLTGVYISSVGLTKNYVQSVPKFYCPISSIEDWRHWWWYSLTMDCHTRNHDRLHLSESIHPKFISSVQLLSHVRLFATPWTAAHQASLPITNSESLLKLMSIESVMPSNHLTFSSPSPLIFNLSQHQGLFQWVSCLHQVARVKSFFSGVSALASVLPMNIQDWFPLGVTGWISLQSKGLSRVFSNTMVHKHQFFGAQLSL